MRVQSESDLSNPVSEWLRNQGLTVYAEAMFVDLVGVGDDGRIVTVELKRGMAPKLIAQGLRNQEYTADSYIAVSSRTMGAKLRECHALGLGLLQVQNDRCEVVLDPWRRKPINSTALNMLLADIQKWPNKDGTGGLPYGCGAQLPDDLILNFIRLEFPKLIKERNERSFSEITI